MPLCGTTSTRNTGDVHISYRSLVGADGATSAVRRLLTGRNQRVAVSLEGVVPTVNDDIVCEFHPAQQGYCWYIPANQRANIGCMLHDGTGRDCRAWIAKFCEGLGIDVPTLRGALIPAGNDVLLRGGNDVWLVGDAAGLIRPADGGGIHYALRSAHLLGSSLLGGTPYEQAMGSTLETIAQANAKRKSYYFLTSLHIVQNGHRLENASA